jgi:signal transduction histidine kinase
VSGRRRSLFWPIAGGFLLALVLGTLGQALVADAVLRPLEMREARTRAELVVSSLAGELAAMPAMPDSTALDSILDVHRGELVPRTGWLIWRGADGVERSAPPGRTRMLSRPPGPPPDSARNDRRPQLLRLETVARHVVQRQGARVGELVVIRPIWRRGPFDDFGVRTSLLFLPIGILASALAGLVGVRWLVRRLRGLDALAERVTEGDLSVRIADRSGDEIGRLAENLDRMTDRLAEARDRLASTEQQRRQLFADITHELATPLTSIRGYAETLLDPGVPLSAEERTRYERGVLEESRRLDRLIRDLFELARLEAGASPLTRERLDWVALCRNTVERFTPRFRAAGLALDWRAGVTEAWIEADGHRLEEVLENLLANALRYVPDGGSVELWLDRSPAGMKGFQLGASDDGPGVGTEDLPHVFDRFYRGAGARVSGASRDGGGSGLGLAIVREIIERHGGSVRAERREPHGLTILIEIPATEESA